MKQFKSITFENLEDLREEIEENTDYIISELNENQITIAYSTDDDEDIYETYKLNHLIEIDFTSKKERIFR